MLRVVVAPVCTISLMTALAACGDDGGSGGGGTTVSVTSSGAGGQGTGLTSKPDCAGEPSGSPTPLARADAGAAFSPDGLSVVMFGGDTATVVCGDTPVREHVGDTWLLDLACGGWTELALGAAPGARARHTMSADPTRGRALLFGGRTRQGSSGPYDLFDDVWAFDFASSTWSELQTSGAGPSARSNTASAVVGDVFYVFGGSDTTSATVFAPGDDLWALDLTTNTWSQRATSGPRPPARLFHAMTGDAASGKLYVMAGGDENAFVGPFLADAWAYDIASDSWSEIGASLAAVTDPARIKAGLLAQPGDGGTKLHFFAGHDDGTLGNRNDMTVLDPGGSAWRAARTGDTFNQPNMGACNFPADFTVIDNDSPERRSGFAIAHAPDGQAFVVFGGDTDCGRASDAWWYDATLEAWEIVRATPVGLSCLRFSTQCSGLCG